MNTLVSLLLLLAFLAGGYLSVKVRLFRNGPVFDHLFTISLYLLLFSMGLRLGQSREIISNLSLVGVLALVGTLSACAGTVLLQILCTPLYRLLDPKSSAQAGSVASRDSQCLRDSRSLLAGRRLRMLMHNLKKPMILLLLVLVGSGVGLLLPQIQILKEGTIATWLLYILLFIIGIQMASAGHGLASLLLQPSLLVLPAVTVAGTLLGSLATLLVPGMTVGKAFALASGFGWYSLSGVIITDLGDPVLGAAAFLSNLFRETLAFIMVPLLYMTGRAESGIGFAGATSMDVTLPVIEDTWGARIVPLSVGHGVILSFLVPFLVPLFMSF